MNTAQELSKIDLFDGMTEESLAAFAGIAKEKKFGPEETVYAADTAGDCLYCIVEGSFAVRVKDEHEEEIDVAHLKPGTVFGEMEVISGTARTASIVSESDGRCYRMGATELLELLERNDGIAAGFYKALCVELIKRLRHTTRNMGFFKVRAH